MNENDTFNYFNSYPDPRESAKIIVPLLMEMLAGPRTAVDLGGGIGAWGEVFRTNGVERYICIDDPRIKEADLRIPSQDYVGYDLSAGLPAPIPSDLAVSLEFAEHVQGALSREIVNFLVASAPVVLFAASIPGQPGLHHVNEQPPKYWKTLFAERGYRQLDLIRPKILDQRTIPYWYRQNLFVYANEARALQLAVYQKPFADIPDDFELVHERVLNLYRAAPKPPGIKTWLRGLPAALTTSLRRWAISAI
jgi:hypothetical protein